MTMVFQIRSKYGMPWGGTFETREQADAKYATGTHLDDNWPIVAVTPQDAASAINKFWSPYSNSFAVEDADERAIHGGRR